MKQLYIYSQMEGIVRLKMCYHCGFTGTDRTGCIQYSFKKKKRKKPALHPHLNEQDCSNTNLTIVFLFSSYHTAALTENADAGLNSE